MFTSRAEYRTLLRQDNADLRLTPRSHEIGLASDNRMRLLERKSKNTTALLRFFEKTSVVPDDINPILISKASTPVKQSLKMGKVLARPNVTIADFMALDSVSDFVAKEAIDLAALEQVEIQVKYAGYIAKEKLQADKLSSLEHVPIPRDFDYEKVKSLSIEARQKLNKIQPVTIAQASRISGVSPSDLSVLLVYMGR
jgi:tRNA uridine 5-carboxymethylaminomethyl modification enzyme